MKLALLEAEKSYRLSEVPVGSIITMGDRIIASSHNRTINDNDPTSHAEINAIRKASKKMGNYRLTGTTMYVTLEPCSMCYGAIIHARISRLVFGAYDTKTGVCGSSVNLLEQIFFNHTPEIKGGVLEKDCSSILKQFFQDKRN